MANEQNLRPAEYKLTLDEQKKGGIASGKARREKKKRGEILREILNTEVTNEKMLSNLRALGIEDLHPTLERYINAVATRNLTKNASIQDIQRINDEIYGPQTQRNEIDLNAEVKSINLNIRKYDDTNGPKH